VSNYMEALNAAQAKYNSLVDQYNRLSAKQQEQ
jgi:hypothetical protein